MQAKCQTISIARAGPRDRIQQMSFDDVATGYNKSDEPDTLQTIFIELCQHLPTAF